MPYLDLNMNGIDIELLTDGVVFNNKLLLKRPSNCCVSNWEELWKRLEFKEGRCVMRNNEGRLEINIDDI